MKIEAQNALKLALDSLNNCLRSAKSAAAKRKLQTAIKAVKEALTGEDDGH